MYFKPILSTSFTPIGFSLAPSKKLYALFFPYLFKWNRSKIIKIKTRKRPIKQKMCKKWNKRTYKNTEFILDCPLSPSRGAHPGVQPVLFHWRKLIFTIPSDNNFENVSCLGVGIFWPLTLPSYQILFHFNLFRSVCCHSLCEFICIINFSV